MDATELAVVQLAASQFGVVARRQLRSLKFGADRIRRRLRSGAFVELQPDVFLVAGSPKSFGRDATAALLAAGDGATLAFDTAAALWNIAGFERAPIHVSRRRGQKLVAIDKAEVHRPRIDAERHAVLLDDLPVTNPTRTLFDLANHPDMNPKRIERAINSAWAARLTSRASLEAMVAEWCKRGRRGSTFLREYLAERGPSWTPPATALEDRFLSIIEEAGMPRPISQVNVGNADRWLGRVDCRDPALPLIGEIDSMRFHIAPLDKASDAQRDRDLAEAGFRLIREKEFDVWHRPAQVAARWRGAREELLRAQRRTRGTDLGA